jgi:hypothetical protein
MELKVYYQEPNRVKEEMRYQGRYFSNSWRREQRTIKSLADKDTFACYKL